MVNSQLYDLLVWVPDHEKTFVVDVLENEELVSRRDEDTPQISLAQCQNHLLLIQQEISFLSPTYTPNDCSRRIHLSHLHIRWSRGIDTVDSIEDLRNIIFGRMDIVFSVVELMFGDIMKRVIGSLEN